jgi:ATP-dependent Zn protease
MASFLEDFQARNRAARQEMIDEEVYKVIGEDIAKAASAMLEAKVEKEQIKELLIKYWDLRPSDATYFLDKAEEEQN